MNKYKILGNAGQGAHGYVMKGVNKETGEIVALKKLLIKNLDEGIPKSIFREICALRTLRSDYIVELYEVIPRGMGLILVMEYLPGSLYDIIKEEENVITEAQIKCYMKMLLRSVKYMHKNHIMHRDLKPANLLIDKDGKLKVADLGLARIYVEKEPDRLYSHQVATRWYRAPELLYGSRSYTNAVDLWAVGCIIGEMYNRKPLFQGESDIEQLAIVLHTLGTPTEDNWPGLKSLPDYNKITFKKSKGVLWDNIVPNVSEELLDLLKNLVQYDFNKRPTAQETLHHSYFHTEPLPCALHELLRPENIKTSSGNNQEVRNFDDFGDFDRLLKEI